MLRFVFLKYLRFILLPFSWLYGLILAIRNKMFDWNILSSYSSSSKCIGIGNLSAGGTGKTPFTAYLIEQLESTGLKIAVVSRGYGRSTKGLLKVELDSKANQVGDEPLMLKLRYPKTEVWVSEKRVFGVKEAEKWGADIILLDDNFQHRSVKVDYQYLLSKYNAPFYKDYPFPAGMLREFKSGAKRADEIIFTNWDKKETVDRHIAKTVRYLNSSVRFASHESLDLTWVSKPIQKIEKILAVSGIANSDGFVNACKGIASDVETLTYSDHKQYGTQEVLDMLKVMEQMGPKAVLVCTEKDWVKLKDIFSKAQLESISMAYLPIAMKITPELKSEDILSFCSISQ